MPVSQLWGLLGPVQENARSVNSKETAADAARSGIEFIEEINSNEPNLVCRMQPSFDAFRDEREEA